MLRPLTKRYIASWGIYQPDKGEDARVIPIKISYLAFSEVYSLHHFPGKKIHVFDNFGETRQFLMNQDNKAGYYGYSVEIFTNTVLCYGDIPNRPEDYVTYKAMVYNSRVAEERLMEGEAPPSYYKFFSKTLHTVQSVQKLFRDYHSPALFSCHWRHHKKFAKEIDNHLKNLNDPKEALNYLFETRKKLMSYNPKLVTYKQMKLGGSFHRRLEFAIRKLIHQIENSSENKPINPNNKR